METLTTNTANTDSLSTTQIRFAYSDGGFTNTQIVNVEETWGEFIDRFENHFTIGDKDGTYFVRGPCKDGSNKRADANIEFSSIIVLDCDSSFDPDFGEIHEGAPDPEQIHDALKHLGLTHCLYTTHSHRQEGKGNRCRAIIPVVAEDKPTLTGMLEWIFHRLAEQDCKLVNVKENSTWSQPWYFPRLATEASEYRFLSHEGTPNADMMAYAQQAKEAPVKIDQIDAHVSRLAPREADSLPARFNIERGSAEALLSYLQSNGYTLKGVGSINDAPCYRLLCPGSTSGNAGVVLFQCTDGTWRVYSHHGSDPLNESDGSPGAKDAFDVYRILDHGGVSGAALAEYERSLDTRPLIRIQPGAAHQVVETVVNELATLNPPPVYQRGMQLVRVAHSAATTNDEGVKIPAGTAHIMAYKPATLMVTLSERFAWERLTKKQGWKPADPAPNIMSAMIDGYGLWGAIPDLMGLSECPILREDGRLHAEAGYDAKTQLYVEGRVTSIELPDVVSQADASAAMEVLLKPFAEFPLVDPDLDRSVILAYLFTLAIRPTLPTAPLFAVSATTPGTGKGLLVEIANRIVRGRDAALMPPVQGRESEDEMRKRITSFVLQGISSLNFDNYSRPLGGDSLNALLTTTEWTDRQLGSSTTIKMPVRCTLAATGNNLTVRGDMTRRSLLIQLDAKIEHPEHRTFNERDLPGLVRRQRPELLRALFTILKGYQQSGCRDFDKDRLGRFEEWSERVCHPIQWLGLPNPVKSQDRLRESDPEGENLAALLDAWHLVHQSSWVTVTELVDTPHVQSHATLGANGTPQQHDLHTALLEVAGKYRQVESRLLGWYLKRNLGRIADGYQLERKDRGSLKGKHAHLYRVVDTTGGTPDAAGVPDYSTSIENEPDPDNDDLY